MYIPDLITFAQPVVFFFYAFWGVQIYLDSRKTATIIERIQVVGLTTLAFAGALITLHTAFRSTGLFS